MVIGLHDELIRKDTGVFADGTELHADPVPGGLRVELPAGSVMPKAFRLCGGRAVKWRCVCHPLAS